MFDSRDRAGRPNSGVVVSAGLLHLRMLLPCQPANLRFPSRRNRELNEADRQEFLRKLSDAAIERTRHIVRYDPSYVRIPYPGGDVSPETAFARTKLFARIAP